MFKIRYFWELYGTTAYVRNSKHGTWVQLQSNMTKAAAYAFQNKVNGISFGN